MPQIEVSQEDYDFLKALAEERRTQDNRCTADPYYYVAVLTKHRHTDPDWGAGFKNVFVEQTSGDYGTYDSMEEALADGNEEDDVQEYGLVREMKHHNVFFTEKAAKAYCERNGHKLDSDEKVYDYVEYGDRNPELERVLRILSQIK